MSKHPYQDIPPSAHWRHAVQNLPAAQIDPVVNFKFTLQKTDKVATAGSCFAQHIARHLRKSGFNYYVVEAGHPICLPEIREEFSYGVFSARYGNIYTSRQLLQLFDRAFGEFQPQEECWRDADGNFIDPFRPTVQKNGFSSKEELLLDRAQHLAKVKHMFQTLDYFVFTLGLTECWQSTTDGAVFPVCPGVSGGSFDEQAYRFLNLGVDQVCADLEAFQAKLAAVNPAAKIILTVSPVPLMATMEKRHVLVSSTASKAILRVAADQMAAKFANVAYFPSYEIITSAFSRGRYFGPDLRSVTEEGVAHVMRLFLLHGAAQADNTEAASNAAEEKEDEAFLKESREIVQVICDEELL